MFTSTEFLRVDAILLAQGLTITLQLGDDPVRRSPGRPARRAPPVWSGLGAETDRRVRGDHALLFMDHGQIVEQGSPRVVLRELREERTQAFLSKVLPGAR